VVFHRHKEERDGTYALRGNPGIFLGYEGEKMPIIYDIEKKIVTTKYHITSWHETRIPGLNYKLVDLINDLDLVEGNTPEISPAEVSEFWKVQQMQESGMSNHNVIAPTNPKSPDTHAHDATHSNPVSSMTEPITAQVAANPVTAQDLEKPKRKYTKQVHKPTKEYTLRKQVTLSGWSKEHQVVFKTDEMSTELTGESNPQVKLMQYCSTT
jgi:hypothetical protein